MIDEPAREDSASAFVGIRWDRCEIGVVLRRVARQIEEELSATYWESLDQMLARMDIISINCPRTPATYHLLSARRLKRVRNNAYIVNTARGEVIDETALVRLIGDGEIAGAGLDVFETEPLPPAHPLWRMPDVILTPHTAAASPRVAERHLETVLDNVRRFAAGQPLRNVVDKQHWF